MFVVSLVARNLPKIKNEKQLGVCLMTMPREALPIVIGIRLQGSITSIEKCGYLSAVFVGYYSCTVYL